MRILALLFLIVGVALAGGAVYFVSNHMPQNNAANVVPEGPKTVRVVAAKVPLRYGDRLTFEQGKSALKFVHWPEDSVPAGAFTSAEELFGEDRSEMRVVTRTIEPDELVLKTKVTGFGGSVRVATQVREGMRAVTIPINVVTGAAGLIAPGDFVDVLFTRNTGGSMSSHILMEKVLVVATDQATDTERNRAKVARTATVEVTRTDAQKLILAMQNGTLSLLLRGVEETTTDGEAPVSVDASILPGAPVKEPEKEPEVEAEVVDEGYRVRVRKGGNVSEERFE